jgi:hypothetical protein
MRHTSRPLLCWLIATRPSPCFLKPFKFLGREKTRRSYRRWLKGFLAFVFRAWRMEPDKRSSLAGIRLSQTQSARLQLIWGHQLWDFRINPDVWSDSGVDHQRRHDEPGAADSTSEDEVDKQTDGETTDEHGQTDQGEDEENFESDTEKVSDDDGLDDDSPAGSSSHESTLSDRSNEIHAAAAELLELLFELCIAFITEEFRDGQPSSSLLVYYSGVLALQGSGETFRTAKLFTPILSQLIYVQQLLFLEYALPYEAHPRIGLERRPRYRQLERLNTVRLKYMVEGAMHPLAEFQSLRDFARVIGRTDPPSFLFRWSDDSQTISHGTKHVTRDSFRRSSEVFVDEAENICQELMFGVLPPVDLSQVKDEINNTSQGFSFVHHPGNHLSEAYLELSSRACTTRQNGLLREGRWNWKEVSFYLDKVEAFQEAVAGMCYLSGGELPRVSELFGLECENGTASARGFYVYNSHVLYLIRHHKSKRSTDREFRVARYLPERASRVVYYHLVYIWPFVRMLRRERQDNLLKHSSTLLFCSDQTPDRPWDSRKLTAILQRASSLVWGWPVNDQLCRQFTIAITEKHVKEEHQRFNEHDKKSPSADMNVAHARQSGHQPLQRANTYGLDGAFPTHLQPSPLQVYEWVSMRWHEFLRQPSKTFPSNISAGVDGLQQQSLPVLGRVPRRQAVRTRPTPNPMPTDIETASAAKRKQRMENSAAGPSHVSASRGNETNHSPKVAPTSPASPLLIDDSDPLIDSPEPASPAPSPERSQQRKHCSTAELHLERQKSIEHIQDAQTGGEKILTQSSTSGDSKQIRLVSQRKKPQPGICGQSSEAASLGLHAKATSSSHSLGSEGLLLSLLTEYAREKEERLSTSVDLKILGNQIRIWSERCSFCYIREYWCSR